MVIPVIGGIGYDLLRSQELYFLDLFKWILNKKDGSFIDIGANIGQTLLKVKSINNDISYYRFEPNIRCCSYLRCLISKNKFSKCEIYPIGASNKLQILKFFSDGATGQGASLIEGFRKQEAYKTSENVIVMDIGSVISNIEITSISIIKIDVEGGELETLQGMSNAINKYRPYIVCECSSCL